ncbi:MAG: prepilin-type N-terminal cleavage/methylation domain-containing protein [Hydrogenophaga sp.]|uniref:PilW family protein n=1 Tax=Hydrogenophaga sp. TaxID=1904254 RepID=UPI002722B71F|nr:prepilin-type N-terminal cleavage/methylation domain-containing protein [Hydrogenophaga sp.]MDO9506079.1 prepilin-type N-terminal cleavage/methylation domain-containing protein [Hydrogenophaga sp.]MDP3628584.1 prepilin-type N-terminal cleavage/methylation domain-containing protein [Hydrogenophaga sp.]
MSAHRKHPSPTSARQAGFSLIELMVALVLGLVVVGGVINIFLTNQQASRSNEDLGRLQESSRLSFELMAREIRQAGGNPCGALVTANVLNNAENLWWANWDPRGTLEGFDAGVEATGIVAIGNAEGERTNNSSAIRVLSGGMFDGVPITGHNPATGVVSLATTNHGFVEGDYVVICDGETAAIAQVTASSAAGVGSITHGLGGEVIAGPGVVGRPGNCSSELAFPSGLNCASSVPKTFAAGGYVTRYSASTWYVGNNARGGTSLFRIGPNDVAPVEVTDGVTNMTIEYLTMSPPPAGIAADWVNAAAIGAWVPTAVAPAAVVAVRLQLDMQSLNNTGTDQAPLRRQLIHVVNLRNRAAP